MNQQSYYLILDIKKILDEIADIELPGRSKMLVALKGQLGKYLRSAKKQDAIAKKNKVIRSREIGTRTRRELDDLYF
jgi:hypothetical protein